MRRVRRSLPVAALFFAVFVPALAAGRHADPLSPVLLGLAVILLAAKIGGDLATRIGQPAVLGELAIGVVLGNLGLAGVTALEGMKTDASIAMLAGIGVLILLFEVGLGSTVAQMLGVGVSSFLVAVLGVAAPFALGWLVGAWLLPGSDAYVHAFLGATLTATSVGITARVLQDLKRSQSPEARIILGAAVIDDVLGLVILAVVTGVVRAADIGGRLSVGEVGGILARATVFLAGALLLGVYLSPRLFRAGSRLRAGGVLIALALSFCFLLSWLASVVGLAPIVGAFAAGLILEQPHFAPFASQGEPSLPDLIRPLAGFLVPIFFVLMGMRTDLSVFARPAIVGLALALTSVAVLGKQVCALGVIGRGIDRLSVGIGMIPRGEVGLIFASIGLTLKVGDERIVDAATYSAIVVMVILTTLLTPPVLKWSLTRKTARMPPAGAPAG